MLGTSLLWRSTVAFTFLKVKSAKCICLLPVVLVLVLRIWSGLHHWLPPTPASLVFCCRAGLWHHFRVSFITLSLLHCLMKVHHKRYLLLQHAVCVLSVSMVVGEPIWAPHSERGGSNYRQDPGGYCPWRFYNFMFNWGDGSPGFPWCWICKSLWPRLICWGTGIRGLMRGMETLSKVTRSY